MREKKLTELTHWDFCERSRGDQQIRPVSLWLIQKGEVEIISKLSQHLPKQGGKRLLLDLKPGSGLIACLFAETEVFNSVIVALDEADSGLRFSHPNVEIAKGSYPQIAQQYAGKVTALICSWMDPEENLTPLIHGIGPQIIIYVRDKTGMCAGIVVGKDGQQEPFDPSPAYRVICRFDAPSHFCLKPRLEKTYCAYDSIEQNEVEIQLKKELVGGVSEVRIEEDPYPWEPFPGSSLKPIWTLYGDQDGLVPPIQTELPGPRALKIIEKDEQYTLSPSFDRLSEGDHGGPGNSGRGPNPDGNIKGAGGSADGTDIHAPHTGRFQEEKSQ